MSFHFFRRFLFCGAPVVPLELANGSTSQRGDFGNHVDSYWQTTRFTGALAKQGMFKGQEMFGCRSCSHVVVFLNQNWRNCYVPSREPYQATFEEDFPFPKVGYFSSLEDICNL